MKKTKKYMDDYNYHDWSSYIVSTPDKAPQGAHYGAVLFGNRREADAYSGNSYYDVPEVTYFAFNDAETLGEWAARATKANKKFFFFRVEKLGAVSVKVLIDVET